MTTHPPAYLAAAVAPAEPVDEVEPGIWQQGGVGGADGAQYDSIGDAYDQVAGLEVYHRVFWGVSPREYREFAQAALTACGEGVLLDAGCGSMLFTARAHQANVRGAVIGTDASLKMLRLARARVAPYEDLRRVAFLKANVLRTPFALVSSTWSSACMSPTCWRIWKGFSVRCDGFSSLAGYSF